MAAFEEHCRDCERLLGQRFEEVNRWLDQLFVLKGPRHRRFRHHWRGVREVQEKFGPDAAKAAVVHIVRDCGRVPHERDYDLASPTELALAPEHVAYDELTEAAWQKFTRVVAEEWQRL